MSRRSLKMAWNHDSMLYEARALLSLVFGGGYSYKLKLGGTLHDNVYDNNSHGQGSKK